MILVVSVTYYHYYALNLINCRVGYQLPKMRYSYIWNYKFCKTYIPNNFQLSSRKAGRVIFNYTSFETSLLFSRKISNFFYDFYLNLHIIHQTDIFWAVTLASIDIASWTDIGLKWISQQTNFCISSLTFKCWFLKSASVPLMIHFLISRKFVSSMPLLYRICILVVNPCWRSTHSEVTSYNYW